MSKRANFFWNKNLLRIFCVGICFLVSQFSVSADDLTLTWNASADTNVTGYKIYYGTVSQVYTNWLDAGNTTNFVVSGLVAGTTYFFAATTYDALGDESDFSAEISEQIIETNSTSVVISVTNSPVTILNPVPVPNPAPVTNQNPISLTVSNPVLGITNSAPNFPVSNSIPKLGGNQPPTLSSIGNVTVNENSGIKTIILSGISSGATNQNQTLHITAVSSNPNLIPKPIIAYINPRTTGTLVFRPTLNVSGSAVITVTINGGNNNNIITQSFTVVVTPKSTSTNPATVLTTPIISRPLLPVLPVSNKPTNSVSVFAPQISKQLTNTVILKGKTISFSIAATGIAPLQYQWKFNGKTIPAATDSTLTLKNVQSNQAGAYTVSISNQAGTTNSVVANLGVYSTSAAILRSTTNNVVGQFNFSVDGISGSQYVVQASTNLKDWVSIQTNTAPFSFCDADAGKFSQRFYRTYSLP
jgi:hypothetical protein